MFVLVILHHFKVKIHYLGVFLANNIKTNAQNITIVTSGISFISTYLLCAIYFLKPDKIQINIQ